MDHFRLLCLFSLVYVVGTGHADKVDDSKSWTSYWNSALTNSPLPSKAVQKLLNLAGERSYHGIGKDAASITPHSIKIMYADVVTVTPNKARARIAYAEAVNVRPDKVKVEFEYAIGHNQKLKTEPDLTTFFQGKDLQNSKITITLKFLKPSSNKATLMPRQVTNLIPFSSTKFSEILTYFKINPKSPAALQMKTTIKDCETPAIKGEEKYCATSLESLVDFAASKLGKRVQVYATEAEIKVEKTLEYHIDVNGVQRLGEGSIVCHKENYVYGVFYCHRFYGTSTKAYMVPLVGVDGVAKAGGVVVCHVDTRSWNPKHLAFQVLKIKPGNTIPVCHFLATTSLLWVPMK